MREHLVVACCKICVVCTVCESTCFDMYAVTLAVCVRVSLIGIGAWLHRPFGLLRVTMRALKGSCHQP